MRMTKEEKKKLKPTSSVLIPMTKTSNKVNKRVAKKVVGIFKRKGFGMNYFNKKDN